jgi:hypothetical protein
MPNLVDTALKAEGAETGVVAKNNPPLSPVGPYLHGPSGLFNRRDRENPVISTIMSPMMGVAESLPVYNGARNLDNNFGGVDAAFDTLITGVSAGALDDFANQPTAPCQDGPTGGLISVGSIVNTFGHYKAGVREVEINRAGRVTDMTDAYGVQVLNQFPQGLFATPTGVPSLGNAVNNELSSRIFESNLSFQRMFASRVFIGSPANNNGEAKDITGLDIHINAGNKRDATNGNLIAAANSIVLNFGSAVVGSATNIVRLIESADAQATWKARRQGLGTPQYIIAMRPELWQEITEVIPAQALQKVIAVIATMTNAIANFDSSKLQDQRNAMRESHLIPVNGRMIQVVEDDTIVETNLGNIGGIPRYSSTIYGIPLTVLNGYPVTFWEYFNHGNNQANAIQQMANGLTWTTDGGLFRWTADFARGCLKLNYVIDPRLRMRTPQIAWRIDNVAYAPAMHFDSWNPSSSYFTSGGVTQGENPKYYSEWSSTPTPIW